MEKQREFEREAATRRVHANGESIGLPIASFDVVSFVFVIHECPLNAIRGLLKEDEAIIYINCVTIH